MKVSWALKGGLGPMFIRVVTVSRMEKTGSIIHREIWVNTRKRPVPKVVRGSGHPPSSTSFARSAPEVGKALWRAGTRRSSPGRGVFKRNKRNKRNKPMFSGFFAILEA